MAAIEKRTTTGWWTWTPLWPGQPVPPDPEHPNL